MHRATPYGMNDSHMPEQRPTADSLLARIKERDRARLRIYIGAAPGVGKTYEMLQEAHALRARGLGVVIGFVETYGHRNTEAQIKDLEVIPRRAIEYRDVTMEEMDVDAITVSYTHLRAHETRHDLVCRLLL